MNRTLGTTCAPKAGGNEGSQSEGEEATCRASSSWEPRSDTNTRQYCNSLYLKNFLSKGCTH